MNRRDLFKTALGTTAAAYCLSEAVLAQDAGVLFVNAETGADTHPGTKASPLKTISAAAKRVNEDTGTGAVTITLAAGVYAINETALFKPNSRAFTQAARLTIRAETLPDDPAWTTASMPVLIHTMPLSPNWMGRPDGFGGVSYGMQFETSHVTVQGLKILGTPHIESPTANAIHRVYPIAREGAMLDDLEIKQCLFVGNREVVENHCAILARGSGIVVDHCVFHGCKITIVYWTGQAKGCAMRNTLTTDNYVTGAWLCAIADDFEFSNNVMSGNFSGVLFQGAIQKYTLANSLFAGNKNLWGAGGGPAVNFRALEPSALALPASSKVTTTPVQIELNQSKRDYLHVIAGTPGSDIPAGLFTKRA